MAVVADADHRLAQHCSVIATTVISVAINCLHYMAVQNSLNIISNVTNPRTAKLESVGHCCCKQARFSPSTNSSSF